MPLHDPGTESTLAVRIVAERGEMDKRQGERNELVSIVTIVDRQTKYLPQRHGQ